MSSSRHSSSSTSYFSYPTSVIYEIFKRHFDCLYEKQNEALKEIDRWAAQLYNYVSEHTAKQKRDTQQACQSHEDYLTRMREDHVATSVILRRDANREEIDRLIEKCRALTVQLVRFDYDTTATQFIRAAPVDPMKQYTEDQGSASLVTKPGVATSSTTRPAQERTPDRTNDSSSNYKSVATQTDARAR